MNLLDLHVRGKRAVALLELARCGLALDALRRPAQGHVAEQQAICCWLLRRLGRLSCEEIGDLVHAATPTVEGRVRRVDGDAALLGRARTEAARILWPCCASLVDRPAARSAA